MVRQHHLLNGHEFEQTPGDSGGQRSLVGYRPWGHKELEMTECQNNHHHHPTGNYIFPHPQSLWFKWGPFSHLGSLGRHVTQPGK